MYVDPIPSFCVRRTRADTIYVDTQLLAQELCGLYYRNNEQLGSSVTAAIALATPIASIAVAGRHGTDLSDYPQCMVSEVVIALG